MKELMVSVKNISSNKALIDKQKKEVSEFEWKVDKMQTQ